MRRFSLLFLSLTFLAAPIAFGQATRTWVSGVGDDANPCSRTAPCKTFAGAISKTAAGGEISVLDPGGYGAVTITKSITINGNGTLASILFSGTNGVVINGPGIVVNLIDLSINGGAPSQPGITGVRIISAARVSIQNCDIFNFSAYGILDARTTPGLTVVEDTNIFNSVGSSMTMGIRLLPASGSAANVLMCDNCKIWGHTFENSFGIHVSQGGKAFVRNSAITGNMRGVSAVDGEITVSDSELSGNGHGVRAATGGAVRLSGVTITGNTVNGLDFGGGIIASFGNNRIAGNAGNNGAGLSAVPQQ